MFTGMFQKIKTIVHIDDDIRTLREKMQENKKSKTITECWIGMILLLVSENEKVNFQIKRLELYLKKNFIFVSKKVGCNFPFIFPPYLGKSIIICAALFCFISTISYNTAV